MLNDNAKKWVAALRNGEYEQGIGYLCKDGKYCCLGVACDLFVKSGGNLDVEHHDDRVIAYNGSRIYMPSHVVSWLGLSDSMGQFGADNLTLNNDSGKSFVEIADLIESEPEGLFVQEVTH